MNLEQGLGSRREWRMQLFRSFLATDEQQGTRFDLDRLPFLLREALPLVTSVPVVSCFPGLGLSVCRQPVSHLPQRESD